MSTSTFATEQCSAINAARAKRAAIIEREGDQSGVRNSPEYLKMLVDEEIAQRQLIAECKKKKDTTHMEPRGKEKPQWQQRGDQPRLLYINCRALSILRDEMTLPEA